MLPFFELNEHFLIIGGINNQVQHPSGKVPPWANITRLLKYPMRERNHSPHGFDFSDFLFAF